MLTAKHFPPQNLPKQARAHSWHGSSSLAASIDSLPRRELHLLQASTVSPSGGLGLPADRSLRWSMVALSSW